MAAIVLVAVAAFPVLTSPHCYSLAAFDDVTASTVVTVFAATTAASAVDFVDALATVAVAAITCSC